MTRRGGGGEISKRKESVGVERQRQRKRRRKWWRRRGRERDQSQDRRESREELKVDRQVDHVGGAVVVGQEPREGIVDICLGLDGRFRWLRSRGSDGGVVAQVEECQESVALIVEQAQQCSVADEKKNIVTPQGGIARSSLRRMRRQGECREARNGIHNHEEEQRSCRWEILQEEEEGDRKF
jgi:hypothetical protein